MCEETKPYTVTVASRDASPKVINCVVCCPAESEYWHYEIHLTGDGKLSGYRYDSYRAAVNALLERVAQL